MRMILSMGRVAMDFEMQIAPKHKGKAKHMGDIEVHEIESDTDIAPHIIGFIPEEDDEDGDDDGMARHE